MDQSMAAVMRNINDALRLDKDSHDKEAYKKYLDCIFCITCNLQQSVLDHGGDVVVSKQVNKQVKLAQQCVDRVAVLVDKIGSTQNPVVLRSPTEEMRATSKAKPFIPVPPLSPEPTANTFIITRDKTPMEIAYKQNHQLMVAYRARMARMNKQGAFNLSLTIQRKMAENMALARKNEMALAKKMQERQDRLEEQAAKRFTAPIGMSEEEQQQRQIYKKILEYEQDAKWLQKWRENLSSQPQEPELMCQLIQEILHCRDHPLTVLLKEYQRKVYEKIYPLVSTKKQRLMAVTVPLDRSLWPPDKKSLEGPKDCEDERSGGDEGGDAGSWDPLGVSLVSSVEGTGSCLADKPGKKENRLLDTPGEKESLSPSMEGKETGLPDQPREKENNSCEKPERSVEMTDFASTTANKEQNGHEGSIPSDSQLEGVGGQDIQTDGDNSNQALSSTSCSSGDNGNSLSFAAENMETKLIDGGNEIEKQTPPNEDDAARIDIGEEKSSDDTSNVSCDCPDNSVREANGKAEVNEKDNPLTTDRDQETCNNHSETGDEALGLAVDAHDKTLTQITLDVKKDVSVAIEKGERLQTDLKEEQAKAIRVLRQLSQDYESYNAENMDDLFDDDDNVEETTNQAKLKQDAKNLNSPEQEQASTPTSPERSGPDSLISRSSSGGSMQDFPSLLSVKEDAAEIERMSKEAYQRHVKNISADVHLYLEKLQILFRIAYEQLDCPVGRDQCYASLEETFFKPLWKFLLMLFRLANYKDELSLACKMTQAAETGPRELGVRRKLCLTPPSTLTPLPSPTQPGGGIASGPGEASGPYQQAVLQLSCIKDHYTMLSKLECVVKVVRQVCDSVKEFYTSQGYQPDNIPSVGADDLVPVISYVVLQSRLPQLVSECQAMAEFIHEGYIMGQEGYCLTTLETAVSYLVSCDLSQPLASP